MSLQPDEFKEKDTSISLVEFIEKEVHSQIKLCKEFTFLLTVPRIGDILPVIIMLEVGDINRFPRVGDYSSYCCKKREVF